MKKDKLSWAQMVCEAEDKGLTLIDFLLERSAAQLETDKQSVLERMGEMFRVMEESVAFGMTGVKSNSGLTGGSAKKRKEYIDTKISLLNTTSLPSNIGYYLLGGKNRNYKNTKEIFLNNINNTNENIRKNNLKKINYQALLPLNKGKNWKNWNIR